MYKWRSSPNVCSRPKPHKFPAADFRHCIFKYNNNLHHLFFCLSLYSLFFCLSLTKNMDGTCKYCFVSSVGLKLGQFIINPPLMYTPHRLAKCQFASLSVCFLLLASDNSSLGAEEQYDSGVQAAFLGMVPPLSCV